LGNRLALHADHDMSLPEPGGIIGKTWHACPLQACWDVSPRPQVRTSMRCHPTHPPRPPPGSPTGGTSSQPGWVPSSAGAPCTFTTPVSAQRLGMMPKPWCWPQHAPRAALQSAGAQQCARDDTLGRPPSRVMLLCRKHLPASASTLGCGQTHVHAARTLRRPAGAG
jgi:hypothetical protein